MWTYLFLFFILIAGSIYRHRPSTPVEWDECISQRSDAWVMMKNHLDTNNDTFIEYSECLEMRDNKTESLGLIPYALTKLLAGSANKDFCASIVKQCDYNEDCRVDETDFNQTKHKCLSTCSKANLMKFILYEKEFKFHSQKVDEYYKNKLFIG